MIIKYHHHLHQDICHDHHRDHCHDYHHDHTGFHSSVYDSSGKGILTQKNLFIYHNFLQDTHDHQHDHHHDHQNHHDHDILPMTGRRRARKIPKRAIVSTPMYWSSRSWIIMIMRTMGMTMKMMMMTMRMMVIMMMMMKKMLGNHKCGKWERTSQIQMSFCHRSEKLNILHFLYCIC